MGGRFAQAQTRAEYLADEERDEQLHLDPVIWGHAPGWWDKAPLINARVETAVDLLPENSASLN